MRPRRWLLQACCWRRLSYAAHRKSFFLRAFWYNRWIEYYAYTEVTLASIWLLYWNRSRLQWPIPVTDLFPASRLLRNFPRYRICPGYRAIEWAIERAIGRAISDRATERATERPSDLARTTVLTAREGRTSAATTGRPWDDSAKDPNNIRKSWSRFRAYFMPWTTIKSARNGGSEERQQRRRRGAERKDRQSRQTHNPGKAKPSDIPSMHVSSKAAWPLSVPWRCLRCMYMYVTLRHDGGGTQRTQDNKQQQQQQQQPQQQQQHQQSKN